MTTTERSPKLFDYFAGAILTNGLAMIAIYLAAWELLFQYLLIPLWFVAAGVSTYLVCMRTTKNHLLTGAKTAVLSIVLGFFMVPTLQGLDLGILALVLVCYLIGSIGGAYYALREQLKMKKKAAMSPPNVEP
ncbi:MAG: hypothetical protein NTV61_05460 [Candidatus Bathyarchaeota archaeon]|nr:hypothetical protein [Candidatus Bathyarchaeota archaeon]